MDQSHSNILGKMGFISWLQATKNWKIIPLEITSVSFLTLKLFKDQTASTTFEDFTDNLLFITCLIIHTFHLYHEIYLCSTFYCTLFKASCIIVRKEAVIKVVTKHCSLGALIEKQICVAKTTDFSCMKKYATTYKNVKTFQGLL